ncbi:Gfo/Idh/MocA family oxidoreductase [Pseudokineococcus marinus]|uniref:Gfo/Idh/MocA family oxidoreductase n=1 Tax=Pseudokineococcus marinus TaxID=351215 RepID=A0A849BK51_9ACTN|nr:Gfo/Idh/MocA family oxidoreductase [Pseudokineococcus marinus]NNH22991.1 Gfo/Idh/MocA family oxidoreductase [Pseudokineococcus marinus]
MATRTTAGTDAPEPRSGEQRAAGQRTERAEGRARTRVAVVGTGGVSGLHAEAVAAADDLELVGCADPDVGRVADFAGRWGAPVAAASLEEMLDRLQGAGGVDVVALCSPPWLHAEQAVACLERDVTALVEKPVALSLAQLDEVAAAEAASRGWCATVAQHRFGGRAVGVREMLRRGDLGRVDVALCETLWYRPDAYFAVPWRGRWDSEGGGPTMGHGIHQVDLLLSLAGPWRSVTARAARRARPTETEDVSTATVELEDGGLAVVVSSVLCARETSRVRLDCERGTVELEHLYGYDDDDWTLTPAPGRAEELAPAWAATAGGGPSGHAAQYREVRRALLEGRPPPVTTAEARSTLELAAALYASAATGATVARGEVDASSPFHASMRGGAEPSWSTGG